jgi:hypothetical protein
MVRAQFNFCSFTGLSLSLSLPPLPFLLGSAFREGGRRVKRRQVDTTFVIPTPIIFAPTTTITPIIFAPTTTITTAPTITDTTDTNRLQFECAKKLLDAGAKTDYKKPDGWSPILIACGRYRRRRHHHRLLAID